MTPLLLLYALGTVHACFAGYREAAGKNLRIRKFAYYARATVRGFIAGQAAALLIVLTLLALAARLGSLDALFTAVGAAAWAASAFYSAYALLIALAFAFFVVPSTEVRTLTSVLVFGPFTLGLKAVIVAGALVGYFSQPRFETAVLFTIGAAAMLAVEPALGWTGISNREATVPSPQTGRGTG